MLREFLKLACYLVAARSATAIGVPVEGSAGQNTSPSNVATIQARLWSDACAPRLIARHSVPQPCAPMKPHTPDRSHQCVVGHYTICVAMKGGSTSVTEIARNWTRRTAPNMWALKPQLGVASLGCLFQQPIALSPPMSTNVLIIRNPFVRFCSAVIHKGSKILGISRTTARLDANDVTLVRRVAHELLRRRRISTGFIALGNPHFLPIVDTCTYMSFNYSAVVELGCVGAWLNDIDLSKRTNGASITSGLNHTAEFNMYCKYYDRELVLAIQELYAADFAAGAFSTTFYCPATGLNVTSTLYQPRCHRAF